MNQFFTVDVLTVTVASGIALATPFLLAALGETIGQRSGVINLGVDGIIPGNRRRRVAVHPPAPHRST